MHRLLLSSAIAGTLAMATLPASAMPGAQPIPSASAQPELTLVSGFCGPFRHRGWNGACYPNGPIGYGYYGYGYGWHRPWGWGGGWHRWHRW